MKKRVIYQGITFIVVILTLIILVNGKHKLGEMFDTSSISASLKLKMNGKVIDEEKIDTQQNMIITPGTVKMTPIELYDSMSIEEKEAALQNGTLHLEYTGLYTSSDERLTISKGAIYYNGHKETYYSERVLPGESLNIPGRHAADDGTIRDGDGYICVAADQSYMSKGSILITSLGPAKVYDSGCAYGTIDIYVNW